MNVRFPVMPAALLLVVLGAAEARSQSYVSPKPAGAAPKAEIALPDACKLMPQADLEALFPGRPIAGKPPMLSAISKGPQYPQGCMYVVRLPSPTSKRDVPHYASITIVQWGDGTQGIKGSAATFENMRSIRENLAADPKNNRAERLRGIGEEAFAEISPSKIAVNVRVADLIFVVSLDIYNPQSQPNAAALARQAAKRWSDGRMVEAATPIEANFSVDIPEDTRVSIVAPADQWPDACALLSPEDVRLVFGDMIIEQPRKTMGQITHESRIDRVEDLPKPIGCFYETYRTDLVGGERKVVVHDVQIRITNMAATPEQSQKSYRIARDVGGAKTEIPGLGDEAAISIVNEIYIRKGLLTLAVRVGGGDRDMALHNDAARRVNEIAQLVVAKLP